MPNATISSIEFAWRLTQTPYNVCFMARPPRIPVMLPWECKVIYFVMICITSRYKALANDSAWNAICETLNRLDKWEYLLRNDHA